MTRLKKTAILILSTVFFGTLLSAHHLGLRLEKNLGLSFLFQMRGVREAPKEVVVVALDKASVTDLGLSRDLQKWPRSLHAQLVEKLSEAGADVIVFDIFFRATREADPLLSDAMIAANNVVLVESTEQEVHPSKKDSKAATEGLILEKRVNPTPALADAAIASAPFPLPKMPVRVNEFWLFKNNAADVPTLPVVAFQLFSMDVYEEMMFLFKDVLRHPRVLQARRVPQNAASFTLLENLSSDEKNDVKSKKGMSGLIQNLKRFFEKKTMISEVLLSELSNPDRGYSISLKRLIAMYAGGVTRYLNYYGPPGTVLTIPYFKALEISDETALDFKGKVVFIGSSETVPNSRKKDDFHTVFSQSDGLKLSGVEIAATAFANLLEDMPIRPTSALINFLILLFWGSFVGGLWFLYSPMKAAMTSIGAGLFFAGIVFVQFKNTGLWIPFIIPLFFQTPFAGFSALLWRYLDSKREQREIKKSFSYFLPDRVVKHLSHRVEDLKAENQLVHGTILYTDIEDYTMLSESMPPKALGTLMSDYFEALFAPVERNGGIVLNVTGDAMLTIWPSPQDDPILRKQACETALEVCDVLDEFNRVSEHPVLRTRLGLHCGQIMLGNIGGGHRLEYTAIGDMANTAARIEGLNKTLGTRLLASQAVLAGLEGFLTRELGNFMLRGKSQAIVIHELISDMKSGDAEQIIRCRDFRLALDLYRKRCWAEAFESFLGINCEGEIDGPSHYYTTLCRDLIDHPPKTKWDAMIRIAVK